MIGELEIVADCYRDANEPAAAAVFDREVQNSAKILELLLALEDVEARRPGLCTDYRLIDDDRSEQEAAHIECLADAGETRAATAVQNNPINSLDPLPDE